MVVAPNAADIAIAFARSHIGDPYVFGANGPHAWDCSSLVQHSYAAAGVILPRTTGMQVNMGTAVAKEALQVGDLVFPDFHHVQIYTGNGRIIEAPQTGEFVVERAMWGFWRARRVVNTPGTATSPGAVTDNLLGIGNPVDQSKQIMQVITAAAGPAKWLTEPHNWLRIAGFIAGALFIAVALGQIKTVSKAANTVAKGVANAGGT